MSLKTFTILTILSTAFGLAAPEVSAQSSIRDLPANFPPDSFSGRQFVDNRGCIYVRAGYDGAVNWVPRVTRSRKPICGQTPTFGGAVTAAAEPQPAPVPRPAAKSAAKPVEITMTPSTEPAPTLRPLAAPKPAPRATARAAAPVPKPRATAPRVARVPVSAPKPVQRIARVPASKPVVAQPPRVVRRVPETVAPTANGTLRRVVVPSYDRCTGQRVVNGQTLSVRCGPQKTPHVTIVRRGQASANTGTVYQTRGWQQGVTAGTAGNVRIVPRHVYENRDTQVAAVPRGYRPAWEDDRLNRHRAYQTADGYQRTQVLWTNTVPRQQVTVNTRGHEINAPVIIYRVHKRDGSVVMTQDYEPRITTQSREPVVSTRTEPQPAMRGKRFVEIGVFTTDAKAQRAATLLRQAGLPVKFGTYARNGQQMRRVMVGPYASPQALDAALRKTRSVGYAQAYLR